MELEYETMKEFMERYFRDYSAHVNSPERIDQLNELYTADFTSVLYIHIEGMKYPFTRAGREEFKKSLLQGHATIREKLFPNNIIIDERKKIAGVLLTSEKTILKTGETHAFDGIGFYHLTTAEENKIKIKRLEITTDDPDRLNRIYFQTMQSVSGKSIEADAARQ